MSDPPSGAHARLRAAVYGADGKVRGLFTGTRAMLEANTPPGGHWEAVADHVRRVEDIAPSSPPSPATPPPQT